MFETAVGDGAQEFVLEQEVAETGGVNADVATLLVRAATGDSQVTLLVGIAVGRSGSSSSGGGGGSGLQLLVGVIDQILFVRHVDGEVEWRVDRGSQGSGSSIELEVEKRG